MTDRYDVISVTRLTLTTLSLMLIVLSVLAPMLVFSTPVVLAMSADRIAESHLDAVDLIDNIVLPVNAIHVAWSPVVSVLTLTAVSEQAWYPRPPIRPPSSIH